VFTGSNAVSWLVENANCADEREAIFLGNRLIDECKLFHHVTHDHMLKDTCQLYRFRQTDEDRSVGMVISGWLFKQPESAGWGSAQRRWFELDASGQLRWSVEAGGKTKGSLEFVGQGYHFEEVEEVVGGRKFSFRLTPSASQHARVFTLSPEDNTKAEMGNWKEAFASCHANRMRHSITMDQSMFLGRTGSILNLITTDLPNPDAWPSSEPMPQGDFSYQQLASLQCLCKVSSWRHADHAVQMRRGGLRPLSQGLQRLVRSGTVGSEQSKEGGGKPPCSVM
jgi:hypothetical protein